MSAAWHLHALGFDVKVFEKDDRIGGKARTTDVIVGEEMRWVDLGVNDFNARTYVRLISILDDLSVEYRPLEDTTCFYTLDGSLGYTTDGFQGTAAPKTVSWEAARFRREALEVLAHSSYRYASVKEYVTEKGYSADFLQYYLYPRINAMYFAGWEGVANMPIWPVVQHCSLQEGLELHAAPSPQRMYFVNGSREWMTKLYEAARAKFPIVLNAEASVHAGNDGVTVVARGDIERFDKVVLAQQAGDALRSIKSGLTPKVAQFLAGFRYHHNEIVAHTYYGVLAPRVKVWRTYNILVHKNAAGPHRYTITYVVNRHQNDAHKPRRGALNTPHFFVTVNSPVPIPDSHVLRQPDGSPARTLFQDIAFDLEALRAQERRSDLQGINNVYLTGAYARGTGLHEECWTDGMELATHIKRKQGHDRSHVELGKNDYYPRRDVPERVAAGLLR